MELKVWVEGIQRVVCGVSDVTTCQDVVIALAHATGKTGRFTLVERWRENERLIAPLECPLKVLRNWGEYASDVQFVLKHSVERDKARIARTNLSTVGQKRPHNSGADLGHVSNNGNNMSDKFFPPHRNLLPSIDPAVSPHIKGVVKRNLTFSGAHHSSAPLLRPPVRHMAPFENTSLDSVEEHSSMSSHSGSSPYSSFQSSSTGDTIRNRLPFGQSRIPSGAEYSRLMHAIEEPDRASPIPETSPSDTPTNSLDRNGHVHYDHYDMNAHYGHQNKVLSASLPINQNTQHLLYEDKLSPRASSNQYVPNRFQRDSNALIHNRTKSNHNALVVDTQLDHKDLGKDRGMSSHHVNSSRSHQSHQPLPNGVTNHDHIQPMLYELPNDFSNNHETYHSRENVESHSNHMDYDQQMHSQKQISNNFQQDQTANQSKHHIRAKSPSESYELALHDSSNEMDENKNTKKSLSLSALLRGRGLNNVSRDDLVRLVNLQIERLNSQEEQMKSLETDVSVWEEREHESCKRLRAMHPDEATDVTHLDHYETLIQNEISQLEAHESHVNSEICELEIVSWADKLEMERDVEKRLRSEMEDFRIKMTSQSQKVADCQTHTSDLERQIAEEQIALEREKKELEIKLLQEIADLQKQVNQKLVEHESQEHNLDDMTSQVKAIESAILERKMQMAEMEKDLKEINLELFNSSPPREDEPEEKTEDENAGQLHRSSSSRPVSSRIMPTTPAQLKNAIQSEPQGYWV